MARQSRIDTAGNYYHCMNRANARLKIHFKKKDYLLFLKTLKEAQEIFEMDILAFSIMPNHFHLVIYTKMDGEMGRFMRWLTLTHTQRWHRMNKTIGTGHLYQGRYKSVLIKDQIQLATVIRYTERNPLTANLASNVLAWKYSSLYQIYQGVKKKYKIKLALNHFERSNDYLKNLIKPLTEKEDGVMKKLGD